MAGSYDFRLVALSVVIAVFAAYAALDLAGRVTASQKRARRFWLTGGATSMGLGIWSMHYVGMLAFRMPMKMYYHPPTVLLSLLAAIAASAVALYTVSRKQMSTGQLVVGSLFMGAGIAAMHYIGMAAMRVQARIQYNPGLVIVSIGLAVAISMVALLLSFRVREERKTSGRKIVSALIMGSAIPVMHYTGMWAASFLPTDTLPNLSNAASISSIGLAAIATSTLLVLALVMVTAFLDRLLSAQKAVAAAAREGELSSRPWRMLFRKLSGRHFRMGTSIFTTSAGTPTPAKIHNAMIWDGVMCSIQKTLRSVRQPGGRLYRRGKNTKQSAVFCVSPMPPIAGI